eukprot:5019318-Amphidinium_carterae.1
MMWNNAVSKMQQDPADCVRKMSCKRSIDRAEVVLGSQDLKAGLDKFNAVYNRLLQLYLRDEIALQSIIA